MAVYVDGLVSDHGACSRNHILSNTIRSVDSLSTVFKSALVKMTLNSLLCKPRDPRQHFHVAAFQLQKSYGVMKALQNIINYESLHFSSVGITIPPLILPCFDLKMGYGLKF